MKYNEVRETHGKQLLDYDYSLLFPVFLTGAPAERGVMGFELILQFIPAYC